MLWIFSSTFCQVENAESGKFTKFCIEKVNRRIASIFPIRHSGKTWTDLTVQLVDGDEPFRMFQ
jgi:hypothetical protein